MPDDNLKRYLNGRKGESLPGLRTDNDKSLTIRTSRKVFSLKTKASGVNTQNFSVTDHYLSVDVKWFMSAIFQIFRAKAIL